MSQGPGCRRAVQEDIQSGCFLSLWLKREAVTELDGSHHCPTDDRAVRACGERKG